MLKILGRDTSINVRKVLWCADELGLPYEREDWGLPLRDPAVPEFLALNPNAQVPVIIADDGFVLWESSAILRHLAGTDSRLVPADPRERAIADQWLTWQATELNPPWGYAVMALLRHAPGYDDEARIVQSLSRWAAKMAILEGRLASNAYAAGPRFTLADIALGLSIHRWLAIPREKPAFPAAWRYYETLRERPAGAEWMSERFF